MKHDYILDRSAKGKYKSYYESLRGTNEKKNILITIFDTTGGQFSKKQFRYIYSEADRSDLTNWHAFVSNFERSLQSRPADSPARIIWVAYDYLIDPDVLKNLGTTHSIDSAFVPEHTYNVVEFLFHDKKFQNCMSPRPSQHRFFLVELHNILKRFTAAFYCEADVLDGAKRNTSK
jgi:hypothetical protein